MNREMFLKEVPLFHSLTAKDTTRLGAVLSRRSLKKGEVVFRKGSEGDALYIVKNGSIKIALPSPDGEEMILALFSRGDFFGEMALVDGMPRSADAVALEPSDLFVLDRKGFLGFLKGNESAIQAILTALSLRLRKTDDLLEDTCFLNISARFAKKLVELAENHGRKEGKAVSIDLDLTQRDLASMVGATRESINKELRILREKGIVCTEGNNILIHNLERLSRRFG